MVRVFLVHRADSGSDFNGCVASIAEDNRVLATIDIEIYEDALKFADPATDATGNVFVLYNPGRYDGVLVLVPNEAGFEDIGWGDPALHYRGGRLAYYNAELDGPGEDGRYTIVKSDNPCNPSCAEGATWSVVLRWNGREYLPGE